MFALQAVSSEDRRRSVHTEVRSPIEVTLSRIVSWVFTVIVVFLGLRFILLLLGANEANAFVAFVYAIAGIFMAPFATVFPQTDAGGSTFQWSILVAMLVYALISWGILALIRAISPREYAATVESDVVEDRAVAGTPVIERPVVVDDGVDREVIVERDPLA